MSPYAYLPMLTHSVCLHTLTYQSSIFNRFAESIASLLSNATELVRGVEQEEWEQQRRLIALTPSPQLRHVEITDPLVAAVAALDAECRRMWRNELRGR